MTAAPRFIDANIFIRYLTQHNPQQSPACAALFQQAKANTISLTTCESVVVEVIYILSSKQLYNMPRPWIQAALTRLLTLPGFKLSSRAVLIKALVLYAKEEGDFHDCLAVAHMEQEHIQQIYSYDQKFDRFNRVQRVEPAAVTVET